MRNRAFSMAVSLVALLAAPAQAGSLMAFAGVVGGAGTGSFVNNCTTYSAPPELAPMFGSAALSMNVAGGVAPCGYSGGWSSPTAASGPLANSASLAPVLLGNPGFTGSFDGTANSSASFGSLGASAHGNISGGTPGSPVALFYSTGASFLTDTLTVTSPLVASLSAGFVRYRFSVDGSLSAPGPAGSLLFGTASAHLNLIHQGVGPYFIMAASVSRGQLPTINGAAPGASWSASTGSLSGSETFVSPLLPMVWDQPWDVQVALMAQAYGSADADFLNTARIAGIELFDASGNPVTQFSLASSSGATYGVPEPGLALLLTLAAAAGLARARAAR
jgi:hypothetical protein